MQVTVRLFAVLRELAGSDRFIEAFDAPAVTIDDLRTRLLETHPHLGERLASIAFALNEEYVREPATLLHDGDTVALIPPIGGGANETPRFLVTSAVLEPRALRDSLMTPEAGACVVFEGVVRNHHDGRAVDRLEYEAYEEMAVRELERVGEEVLRDYAAREVYAIGIHHRVGPLAVGETSLVVVVTAAHRADAFEAGERAVDRVKETVPVWKKEWGPYGAHWQEGVPPRPLP